MVALAALWLLLGLRLAAGSASSLYEPIYAYDDIDAHTVAATPPWSSRPPEQQLQQRHEQSPEESPRPLLNLEPAPKSAPANPAAAAAATARHWSGLENYYAKLRNAAALAKAVRPEELSQSPYMSRVRDEPSLAETITSGGLRSPLAPQSPRGSPFNMPIQARPEAEAGSHAVQAPLEVGSVHSEAAPGLSRLPTAANQDLFGRGSPNWAPAGAWAGVRPSSSYELAVATGELPHFGTKTHFAASEEPQLSMQNGHLSYLEWRRLPELLTLQQQQQRARHQHDTFGALLERERAKHLLREEAYCGPPNFVRTSLTGGLGGAGAPAKQWASPSAAASAAQAHYEPNFGGHLELPVSMWAPDYPSHMGVYAGNASLAENFLCGATWIHERFALTVASCVAHREPKELRVRAGEWLLANQTLGTPAAELGPPDQVHQQQHQRHKLEQLAASTSRQVSRVHLFPRFNATSLEHNLALIELAAPIELAQHPEYLCPACQMDQRAQSNQPASACWAPVRNVTARNYFDPHGDGETKRQLQVSMVELPVRLVAPGEELECRRQTRLEYFSFQNPNYICAADFRLAEWRSRLNHSDHFGSGIYCAQAGNLNLVSLVHPIRANTSSAYGYLDLSYYRPWMRNLTGQL